MAVKNVYQIAFALTSSFIFSSFAGADDCASKNWILRPLDSAQLSQYEADQYCTAQGAHLPSADEFRSLIASLNQQQDQCSDFQLPEGTYWTSSKHTSGLSVEFLWPENAFGVTNGANRNFVICVPN